MKNRFISPLPYPGGKAKKWNLIKSYFPKNTEGMTYYEPFFGGGSVGLNSLRENMFSKYIFSDVDEGLIDMFKGIQDWNSSPCRMTEIEQYFYPILKFDNLEKAKEEMDGWLKFLCTYNTNYNSLYHGTPTELRFKQNWNIKKMERIYECNYILRNNNVLFLKNDYFEIKPNNNSFVYLDPPYFKVKKLYRFGDEFDFSILFKYLDILNDNGSKFVLSVNDQPLFREMLENKFNIYEHEWFYSSSNSKRKKCKVGKELIITNFEKED